MCHSIIPRNGWKLFTSGVFDEVQRFPQFPPCSGMETTATAGATPSPHWNFPAPDQLSPRPFCCLLETLKATRLRLKRSMKRAGMMRSLTDPKPKKKFHATWKSKGSRNTMCRGQLKWHKIKMTLSLIQKVECCLHLWSLGGRHVMLAWPARPQTDFCQLCLSCNIHALTPLGRHLMNHNIPFLFWIRLGACTCKLIVLRYGPL